MIGRIVHVRMSEDLSEDCLAGIVVKDMKTVQKHMSIAVFSVDAVIHLAICHFDHTMITIGSWHYSDVHQI